MIHNFNQNVDPHVLIGEYAPERSFARLSTRHCLEDPWNNSGSLNQKTPVGKFAYLELAPVSSLANSNLSVQSTTEKTSTKAPGKA